ncbi:MAG: threonine-phosphate decarboxylase [Clostridiales bacterium]|nr:threonine-phosphate decarboxylase [Clostridiales bacterium]
MKEERINPHGGNIYKASQLYGIKQEDFLDFSANINPLGVPQELREIIIANIDNLVNYPDPECKEVKTQVSRYLDISEENIVIGNGASEVIFLLFEVLRPRTVMIPSPSFSEYAMAAERSETVIKYFELYEQENFKLNIDELIKELDTGIDAVILCNPNNPTSTLISKADLISLVHFAREKEITVIIDEAFIELTDGANSNSMVEYTKNFSNLFIVRAFTKLFAIPGLRLGYGIGNPQLIYKMWERKMPWSVNTFACCAGEFLKIADEYISKTSLWISEELKWFYNELNQIKKLKVYKPKTNFILIKITDKALTSDVLREIMASNRILIRDASNFKFLNDKFFRLAVKDRASNLKVLEVLKEVLS